MAGLLLELRRAQPRKFVSLVRLVWPEIKAAVDRGHSIKVIHEHFVKGGVRISYRLFAQYVGQLRREDAQKPPAKDPSARGYEVSGETGSTQSGSINHENPVAVVRVPKRRLFTAKAAAQYLGIHEQTLKRITEIGGLRASRLGTHRVYKLEDLDSYIDSLPSGLDISSVRVFRTSRQDS